MIFLRAIPLIIIIAVTAAFFVNWDSFDSKNRLYDIPGLYVSADTLFNQSRYDMGFQRYDEIIERDSMQQRAWTEKGVLLNYLERCSESLQHHQEFAKQFPDSANAQRGLFLAEYCDEETGYFAGTNLKEILKSFRGIDYR